jgi:hypothetical protein
MRRFCVLAFAGVALAFTGWNAALAESRAVCLISTAAIPQNSVPRSDEFSPAPCGKDEIQAAFRYDRSSGVSRLARDLAAGDVVERFPEYGADMVLPGQHLKLVVKIGNVRVERQVEALQRARPGERLFVEGGDGQILSVRFESSGR